MQNYKLEVKHNEAFNPAFEVSFYNSAGYLQFHKFSNFFRFSLAKSGNEIAVIYFVVIDKIAKSIPNAPFGGIESERRLEGKECVFMLQEIFIYLKSQDIERVEINCEPDFYGSHDHVYFEKAGLKPSFIELNQHINVVFENTLSFEKIVKTRELRMLKKAQNANFESVINPNLSHDLVYDFIERARKRRGFPLNIEKDKLGFLFQNFPQKYVLFSVMKGENIAALSIGVKVKTNFMYFYLPADHQDFLKYSPMATIVKSMYNYCREEKIEILDLGISSYKGEINEGLRQFKNNMGALETPKHIFYIELL